MFDWQVASRQRINLLYDAHYHVITNLTAAMTKRYVCPACNEGCERCAGQVQRVVRCLLGHSFMHPGHQNTL